MIKKNLGLSLIAASALVMGCSSSSTPGYVAPEGTTLNIVETAQADTTLSALVGHVVTADLVATLSSLDAAGAPTGDVYTVFAPNDAAFTAGPDLSTTTGPDLVPVLTYHVVAGAIDAAAATAAIGTSLTTVNGAMLPVTDDGAGNPVIGGAAIVTPNVYATNGIVHIIDTVLTVPAVDPGTGGTATDVDTALRAAGAIAYADSLDGVATSQTPASIEAGTWTVFAPSDTGLNGTAMTDAILLENIDNTQALDAAALAGETAVVTINGNSYPVVVDAAGAITVGGFAVTELDVTGTSAVYVIEGILATP